MHAVCNLSLLFLFLLREDHKHKPFDPSYFATGFSRHHDKWSFAHINEFASSALATPHWRPCVCTRVCANVYLVTLSSLSSANKSERQAGEQINEVFLPKSARINHCSKVLFLYSPFPFLLWSCWFLEDSATGMSFGCFFYDAARREEIMWQGQEAFFLWCG